MRQIKRQDIRPNERMAAFLFDQRVDSPLEEAKMLIAQGIEPQALDAAMASPQELRQEGLNPAAPPISEIDALGGPMSSGGYKKTGMEYDITAGYRNRYGTKVGADLGVGPDGATSVGGELIVPIGDHNNGVTAGVKGHYNLPQSGPYGPSGGDFGAEFFIMKRDAPPVPNPEKYKIYGGVKGRPVYDQGF